MTAPPLPADGEALLAEHAPELQQIERRLREIIFAARSDLTEYVDMGNKLLGYAVGPKMRDLCFAIIAHKAHVNLQLANGVELADPDGIVEGTGKRIRHVKVRSLEEADRPALRRLIDEELALKDA